MKVKETLPQMVISNQWAIWKQLDTISGPKVKAMILDDDALGHVDYALESTEPIMTMLRFVDTDEPFLWGV